jgi:hypothetical protein
MLVWMGYPSSSLWWFLRELFDFGLFRQHGRIGSTHFPRPSLQECPLSQSPRHSAE